MHTAFDAYLQNASKEELLAALKALGQKQTPAFKVGDSVSYCGQHGWTVIKVMANGWYRLSKGTGFMFAPPTHVRPDTFKGGKFNA
jgi:hypothetical protein